MDNQFFDMIKENDNQSKDNQFNELKKNSRIEKRKFFILPKK